MAEIVEVEENSTNNMQTLRVPPVITVKKSAAYALYQLTYIRVRSLMRKKKITPFNFFENLREIERKMAKSVEKESLVFEIACFIERFVFSGCSF